MLNKTVASRVRWEPAVKLKCSAPNREMFASNLCSDHVLYIKKLATKQTVCDAVFNNMPICTQ